ncbi:hypothetical protein A0H76_1295 [Hepatospora eriocheir]|uniref:Retropepsins domain-containing protein n=1 Tax=Hepatospora eriocheir TaxID=1081669 RepID=A0A1X0QHC3_9MICR|nr:hypothetical protein A0H76_1295 [Hepatospora eriocheir]
MKPNNFKNHKAGKKARTTQGYVNLNLSERPNGEIMQPQTVMFRTVFEDGEEGPQITMKKLTNLENKTNVILWLKQFKETKRSCNWSESKSLEAFRLLIGDNLKLDLSDNSETVEDALNELKGIAFPIRDLKRYQHQIYNIKKHNYVSYQKYFKELCMLKEKINACLSQNDEIGESSLMQYFQNGLNRHDQKEILRAKCDNIQDALNLLETLENVDYDFTPKKFKTFEQPRKQWCDMHRVSSHDNSTCYKQINNSLNQKKSSWNDKNQFIQEPKDQNNNELIINLEVNNSKLYTLIDTGASSNYISSNIISKLNCEEMACDHKIILANNVQVKVSKWVNLRQP